MKRITALFLSVLLLLSLCIAAFGHEAPDLTKKGTITIQWKFQGKALPDGALRAYRIGTLKESDGDFSFAPLPAYQGRDLSEKNLTPELAKELSRTVKASSGIKPASFKNGVVTFDDLELGLYLIVQTTGISGYERIAPFLVSVPMWSTDHYLYEINASEKFETKKEPSSPGTPETPEQPGGRLPQTGQVNWPMPVLLTLGLALIVAGTALKKESKHAR